MAKKDLSVLCTDWRYLAIAALCVIQVISVLYGSSSNCFSALSSSNDEANGDKSSNKNNVNANASSALFSTALPSKKVPDWMIVTDCSTYDVNCASKFIYRKRYLPYPFSFEAKDDDKYEWETLTTIPQEYNVVPTNSNNSILEPFQSADTFPPLSSHDEYNSCLQHAHNITYSMQLDQILERIGRHPQLDMVAFTIADYKYAVDMLHEFFQMTREMLGFTDAMFMVALDFETIDLCCRYGYPVVAAPSILVQQSGDDDGKKDDGLRTKVQSTKFVLSRDLLYRNASFFFHEMDVWWVQSPISYIESMEGDMIASHHQDSPLGINIGVYAALANEKTREYFDLCVQLLESSPNTHDQLIFQEMWRYAQVGKEKFEISTNWKPPVPKEMPDMKHPIRTSYFDSLAFAAQEWPIVHERTLAVHPLCGTPLMTPHGKKMMAKELGAWYGFKSGNNNNDDEEGGYYKRTGRKRRYLMMDGTVLGGHSLLQAKLGELHNYHNPHSLRWAMATLVVLAKRTNRILVLPKVVLDRSTMFLWKILDLSSIENFVDIRETNFASNPKSWYSETEPFHSVARTALGFFIVPQRVWKMFGQPEGNDNEKVQAFKLEMGEFRPIETWFGLMQSPGYRDAELLLVNPQLTHDHWRWATEPLVNPAESPILAEIRRVHDQQLKWCSDDIINNLLEVWPAGRIRASDDCYSKGKTFEQK